MLPLYLSFLGVSIGAAAAPIALVYLLGLAFLMVSTIPVYSGKTIGLKVPRHWVLPIFVLSVAAFGLLVSFPFEMLTVITVCFLGSIPFSVVRYQQLARADAQQSAENRKPAAGAEPPLDSAPPGSIL
jgi:CDP-diacylglycerol--serine O-phosphatidyltransferase